jgi:hypothetical protein
VRPVAPAPSDAVLAAALLGSLFVVVLNAGGFGGAGAGAGSPAPAAALRVPSSVASAASS